MAESKTYLGDSVYASIKNGMIRLATFDGIAEGAVIFLEPEVYAALVAWVESLKKVEPT